jgi:RHS repeat-associated protein
MAYAPFGEGYNGGTSWDGEYWTQFTETGNSWTVANINNGGGSLEDFTYRRYSPTQGRWISPDQAGLAAVDPRNPQSWNRYAYVLNNPLSSMDPSGLFCVWDDGSYDSNHDPDNGSSYACGTAGGTWFNGDPSDWVDSNNNQVFASNDWSGAQNAEAATYAQAINPNAPSGVLAGIVSDVSNWLQNAQFVGIGGSLWIPPNPKYPVAWSPGVNVVSDGTRLHGCAGLAAGGVGSKAPGASGGPLFGNPSQAANVIQGFSVTFGFNLPIPVLGNLGGQIIVSSSGVLAGPTFATSGGATVHPAYSWPCTP